MSRRILMRRQQHAAANEVVSQSDLLATMPRSYAEPVNRHTGNQIFACPADISALDLFFYWRANVDQDSASLWFRERVQKVLRV